MSKGFKEGTSKCLSEEARQERDWQLSREKKEELDSVYFPEMLMVTAMMDSHHGGFSLGQLDHDGNSVS